MSDNVFDLVVIGGGPGGYVAAIRSAQLGKKVAVVEKHPRLGGVCLNEGCIPSKTLLDTSEHFAKARDHYADLGIDISPPRINLPKMMERKDEVIRTLASGIETLFTKNKITWIKGTGSLGADDEGKRQVLIQSDDKKAPKQISADAVLLATGSRAVELPDLPYEDSRIVHARGALEFDQVPERMLVIGGGAIGLELGSVWMRLGTQVVLSEMMPSLLPSMDKALVKALHRILKKQGMDIRLATRVEKIDRSGERIKVDLVSDKKSETLEFDRVLVAAGRRPLTDGIGLETVGAELNEQGRIKVDDRYQTTATGVYAIGDLIHGPMLAHKASDEGVVFAEQQAGMPAQMHYDLIPGVVYTWPEGATVGQTEEQLKEAGIPFTVGSFPFSANGRARCMDDTDGMVRLLADKETGRLLGAHILGPQASSLIAEATTVMAFGGSVQDVELTVHAHPTLPEAFKEAALAASGRLIHG